MKHISISTGSLADAPGGEADALCSQVCNRSVDVIHPNTCRKKRVDMYIIQQNNIK